MLVYIYDTEVEELNQDYNNAIAYIHDREERRPSTQYDYLYIDDYEYSYEEDTQDEFSEYEIEDDLNDFTI